MYLKYSLLCRYIKQIYVTNFQPFNDYLLLYYTLTLDIQIAGRSDHDK